MNVIWLEACKQKICKTLLGQGNSMSIHFIYWYIIVSLLTFMIVASLNIRKYITIQDIELPMYPNTQLRHRYQEAILHFPKEDVFLKLLQ
jgi:hypothetical protein